MMMALLRFYNISTLRVGGNTEFEGETPKKKNVKIHCIDKCHEGDDNKHHLHNDATGSLKAKAVSGAGRCLTFQFLNITSRFQVLFVSTARHFKASIRPKKPSKTEPFRFRDRRPRMYP